MQRCNGSAMHFEFVRLKFGFLSGHRGSGRGEEKKTVHQHVYTTAVVGFQKAGSEVKVLLSLNANM